MRRGLEPMHDDHVNVTPLIDVIMCLIIFFLVCGTLAAQESNDRVVIPRAKLGQELSEQRDRLVINVRAEWRRSSRIRMCSRWFMCGASNSG